MRQSILTIVFSLFVGFHMSYAQSSDTAYLKQAHEFMQKNDEKSAYAMFVKADIRTFNVENLNEFTRASYFTGHFSDALRAAEAGIKIDPLNPVFNRLAMFSCYELKKFSDAKKYLYTFFNKANFAKYSEYDYFYAALIYQALGESANSYVYFEKTLDSMTEDSMLKRWSIFKIMSDSYLNDLDFKNAINYYQDYLASKPDVSFDEDEGLAILYLKYADADKTKQMELINKAIDQYRTLARKYPDKSTYATNKYTALFKDGKTQVTKNETTKELHNPIVNTKDGVDSNIPKTNSITKTMFAVIIGNEEYSDESEVLYAKNDARIFKEYCQQTLGVTGSHIRYIPNAGYNDIRKAVNWLKQGLEAYDGDGSAIFYYAGHGIPDEKQKTAYLLPVDGIGSDVESGYSLEKLYQALGKMPAKSITVFLDACFSGSKRDGGMMASARGVAIKTKAQEPKGNMVVFSAAQGDETAYPYKSQQHGMFTYFLLRKLQETKGDVTLGELADYITREVKRQSFDENSRSQTPTVNASVNLNENWRSMKLK